MNREEIAKTIVNNNEKAVREISTSIEKSIKEEEESNEKEIGLDFEIEDVNYEENIENVYVESTEEEIYVAPEPIQPQTEQITYDGYVGVYTITAYTWTGNTMANGEYPYYGCVASCDFPIGTTLYIEGIGTFVVKDVCPTSGVIDIYMDSYDECIAFGRTSANVYIQ